MNSAHDLAVCTEMIQLSGMLLSNNEIPADVKDEARKLAIKSLQILNSALGNASAASKGIIV